jgi:ribosome biogenesis GTPase
LEVEREGSFCGDVTEICPRKNALVRPAAANIDQAVVIFAAAQPAPNLNLLDRFTVMMERAGIELVLCFNKCDLVEEGEKERLRGIYAASGFRLCFTSAKERQGIKELKELLNHKTTILAGPSGVGKSTTVNLLVPDANMETGGISRKIERGKHTTRHSELFSAGENGYVLDTPGFSTFYLEDMEPEELRFYFPELAREEGNCRFQGCLHLKEPDCRVKELLGEGISKERYHNYELFYEELKNKKRY